MRQHHDFAWRSTRIDCTQARRLVASLRKSFCKSFVLSGYRTTTTSSFAETRCDTHDMERLPPFGPSSLTALLSYPPVGSRWHRSGLCEMMSSIISFIMDGAKLARLFVNQRSLIYAHRRQSRTVVPNARSGSSSMRGTEGTF